MRARESRARLARPIGMFKSIVAAAMLAAAAACGEPVIEESSLTHKMLDCGSADPAVCAMDHYTAIVGHPMTERCVDFVLSTSIAYVSQAAVHHTCGGAAMACVSGADTIVIEDTIDGHVPAVAAHELMHQILWCQAGDYNIAHTWSVWTGLRTDI